MSDLPDFLQQGERARLFPVVADSSREARLTSIILAVLPHVPELAETLLASLSVRVGKRTRIETFTEVVFKNESDKRNRPDGLIVVRNGSKVWSALIESKIGKATLDPDQVARYIEIARANGLDAVLTISNQFVARADVSPVTVSKTLTRKVGLFHWSWTWMMTQMQVVALGGAISDTEQVFLVDEALRLMAHPTSGIERFSQMGAAWKDLIQALTNQEKIKRNSAEVDECVRCWHSEVRDLSLQMSRHVGQIVSAQIEKKHYQSASDRIKDDSQTLVDSNQLNGRLRIPGCAGDIEISCNLALKNIIASMRVKAPGDRKSTKARLNWLIRMLKEDDPRLMIRAHWPGKRMPTQKDLASLREDPGLIDPDDSDMTPHSFEVLLVEANPKRFIGRRSFIEDVETVVPLFYDLVGQHLRAWQPPPPKPVKARVVEEGGSAIDSPEDATDADL